MVGPLLHDAGESVSPLIEAEDSAGQLLASASGTQCKSAGIPNAPSVHVAVMFVLLNVFPAGQVKVHAFAAA